MSDIYNEDSSDIKNVQPRKLRISPHYDEIPLNQLAARPVFNQNNEITALTSLECVDPEVRDFHQYWQFIITHFNVSKVAQGSYASVLRMALTSSSAVYTVWKLMPLKPKKGKGARRIDQTLIEDAAAEVKALACMQEIHGFVEFRSAQVVRGSLPQRLVDINNDWQKGHPDDPADVEYIKDQLWLLIEMSDAGTDLETLLINGFPDLSRLHKTSLGNRLTIRQAWDIFWGTAEALAQGEVQANFEHRDLHPGNVCITKSTVLSGEADQHEIKRYTDLRVTLIDYTLSRATINEGETLANSMKDQTLFTQTSDKPTDRRQHEMYRSMRNLVMATREGQRQQAAKWKEFVPTTNVIWLSHILHLLLDEAGGFKQDSFEGKDASFADIKDIKDRKLAKRLATILNHLRPDEPKGWQYLSATEVVDDEMNRLQRPFEASLEGDSKAMQWLRKVRAEQFAYTRLDQKAPK